MQIVAYNESALTTNSHHKKIKRKEKYLRSFTKKHVHQMKNKLINTFFFWRIRKIQREKKKIKINKIN